MLDEQYKSCSMLKALNLGNHITKGEIWIAGKS